MPTRFLSVFRDVWVVHVEMPGWGWFVLLSGWMAFMTLFVITVLLWT